MVVFRNEVRSRDEPLPRPASVPHLAAPPSIDPTLRKVRGDQGEGQDMPLLSVLDVVQGSTSVRTCRAAAFITQRGPRRRGALCSWPSDFIFFAESRSADIEKGQEGADPAPVRQSRGRSAELSTECAHGGRPSVAPRSRKLRNRLKVLQQHLQRARRWHDPESLLDHPFCRSRRSGIPVKQGPRASSRPERRCPIPARRHLEVREGYPLAKPTDPVFRADLRPTCL